MFEIIQYFVFSVYFNLKSKRNPVRFTVITLSNLTIVANRRWRIRITQLNPRDLPLAAPSHCLQYYTAPNGVVQSFNYMGGAYTVKKFIYFFPFLFSTN
jgi:hypothetical protein